jgi:lipase
MLLNVRRWGEENADCIVCIHGLTQHGGVFEVLARRLVERGHHVLSVDLRGHGNSGNEPPWSTDRHVQDVLETLASFGVRRATWIGHSFGGRVAAAIAAVADEMTESLVLLDPGLEVPPERALREAELERLDWSFETPEGAINALLAGNGVVATSRETIAAYVKEDVRTGGDGRYRFSFCPSAVVTAWSEMCLPAPPIATLPTLVVCIADSLFTASLEERYRAKLASKLSVARVPNGHNVLWESAEETTAAIERFFDTIRAAARATVPDPLPGYVDGSGLLQPLL